jgi:hypothetical protein
MGPGDPGVDLTQCELRPCHQADQPYEGRGAVEDTTELGHDESSPAVAAEDRAVLPADPGEVIGRGGRPLDLSAVVRRDLLGDPRRGDGQCDPATAPLSGHEVEEHQ